MVRRTSSLQSCQEIFDQLSAKVRRVIVGNTDFYLSR
jgi:hypothetical protein